MIKRLQLSGIRSFSPNSEISIDFDEKLTLIIGKNGAGKSTILESLKLAITGTYPPGTENGRCFIHDPKLNSKPDLTGYIRLSFLSSEQNEFKVSRSFQLSRKNDKLEIRKSESLLHYYDADGNEVQKSMRVNEIDNLIPQLFSLNPAILNYVCFCHQDESFWPFGESSLLKKIFDQIFCTEEFSKAQECVRKFVKDKKIKLGQKKEKLIWVLKQVREDQEVRESIKTCKMQIKELEENISALAANEMQEEETIRRMKETEKVVKEVEEKQKELERFQSFLKDLGEVCEAPEESVVDAAKDMQAKIIKLQNRMQVEKEKIKEVTQKMSKDLQEIAEVKAKRMFYEEKVQKNAEEIEKLKENAKEFEGVKENEDEFMKVKQKLKKNKEKCNELERKIKAEIVQSEFEIERMESEAVGAIKKQEGLADVEGIKKEIKFCKESISSCCEVLENEMGAVESLKEFIRLETQNCKVSKEIHEFNQMQLGRSLKHSEICKFFNEIVQKVPNTQTLALNLYESHIKSHSFLLETEKIALSSKKNELEQQINKLITEKITNSKRINEIQLKIEVIQKEIISNIGSSVTNYSEIEKRIKEDLEKLNSGEGDKENYLKAVQKIMEKSKNSKKCEICDSTINVKAVKRKIEKNAKKLAKLQSTNEESAVKKLKYMTALEQFTLLRDYKKEIGALEVRIRAIEENQKSNSKSLEEIENKLKQAQQSSEIFLSMLQYIPKHLETLACFLNQSPEITLVELQSLHYESQLTPFKSSLSHLAAHETSLEEHVKEQTRLLDLKNNFTNKLNIFENTLIIVTNEKKLLQNTIAEIRNKQLIINNSLPDLHDNLHKVLEKYSGKIETLVNQKQLIKKKLAIHTKISESLKNFEKSVQTLESFKTQQLSLQDSLDLTSKTLESLESVFQSTQQLLTTTSSQLDSLNRQLILCRNYKLSKETQQKIFSLSSTLSTLLPKTQNFSQTALKSSETHLFSLRLEKTKHEQSLLLKSEDLKALLSKNPNSEDSAISLFTEVEVLEKALEEQTLLLKALDNSIINFHRSKIFEVNQLISKLWADTYKGNDIEKIWINAEMEKVSKKSSFNYRICCLNKGQEIDMKGRCSSGQKMMASLVIRIALAQAFSGAFSVIALDEPTTNMDSGNAEGLAECVAQISAQFERLQVIIITHDLEFMRKVIRESPRESYLMVEKLKNCSVVTKIKVS